MSRGWFILLAVMVGLKAALLYGTFVHKHEHGERAGMASRWGGMDRGERGMDGGQRHERRLERHLRRMTHELGLEDAQREQIRTIRLSSFEQLTALRESTRERRHEIRNLLQAAELDSGRIRELSASLHEAMGQLETIATNNFIREAAVLTPEQRENYLNWHSFGPRGGRGGGRGGWRRPHRDGSPPDGPAPGSSGP